MAKYVYCTCDQNCDVLRKVAEPGKSIADTHSNLTAEWHPTQNGCYTVDRFTAGAKYKATWICEDRHTWQASISNRARLGSGCPTCAVKKRADSQAGIPKPARSGQSLAERFPIVASAWDYERNGSTTPNDIGAACESVFAWICPEGHQWEIAVNQIVGKHRQTGGLPCLGCKHEKRRVPKQGKSLADVYPEIAKYFHPTKNGSKTAYDYNPRANDYVWWLCDSGHETFALINSKAVGHGCLKCNKKNYSKVETAFKDSCKRNKGFSKVYDVSQRVEVPWRARKIMSVDILAETVSGQKIAIEYDGSYYHVDSKFPGATSRDIAKTEALLKAGYLVVRIRENKLAHLNLQHPNLFQVTHAYKPEAIRESANIDKTTDEIVNWFSQKR